MNESARNMDANSDEKQCNHGMGRLQSQTGSGYLHVAQWIEGYDSIPTWQPWTGSTVGMWTYPRVTSKQPNGKVPVHVTGPRLIHPTHVKAPYTMLLRMWATDYLVINDHSYHSDYISVTEAASFFLWTH